MVNQMVVWYREKPQVAHLSTVAPHNPACQEVSDPQDWWRTEGLLYDIEGDRLQELVTCPHCLYQIKHD